MAVILSECIELPTLDFLPMISRVVIIHKRDGSIIEVSLFDVNMDKIPEVVAVIRCAGSGGYLSADAYDCGGKSLF